MAEAPAFTVTSPWKPPGQELTVRYVPEHAPPGGGDEGGGDDGAADDGGGDVGGPPLPDSIGMVNAMR